jgi:hypothetical protein
VIITSGGGGGAMIWEPGGKLLASVKRATN